ncbi:response regulator [bacterium]|nr:response regulator [bacterium]
MTENRKPTILIVDDEVEILKILKKTLEDDYTIITASRAKEALLKLDSVQVILSDQRMPEMTGSEFLKKVRETHPDIVRIIMTGYSDMNALIESVNQGEIFRYMSKPWDMETLFSIVRTAVEKYEDNIRQRQMEQDNEALRRHLAHATEELNRSRDELKKLRGR